MITSSAQTFVWIWLSNAIAPVVCGRLEVNNGSHDFYYGRNYLNNAKSIALSPHGLPLVQGEVFASDHELHGVFYDSLPDAWGRRVLQHQYPTVSLAPIELLLRSSSDRIGALHFQSTPENYQPHDEEEATVEVLHEAAHLIESGNTLPENLALALMHGTSIGGARPKALVESSNKKYIAKFSSITDSFPIVQSEFAVMRLAKRLGLSVAEVKLSQVNNKYILLIERFDRQHEAGGWSRRFLMSGLNALELSEEESRYASYLDLADFIKKTSRNPKKDLEELFARIVFNILVGNTDDHAKNHAFFWNGEYCQLTPAYDLCPYPRVGYQATQAMQVGPLGNFSLLKNVLATAPHYNLSGQEAKQLLEEMVESVRHYWPEVVEEAELTKQQSEYLQSHAILTPYIFYDEP